MTTSVIGYLFSWTQNSGVWKGNTLYNNQEKREQNKNLNSIGASQNLVKYLRKWEESTEWMFLYFARLLVEPILQYNYFG